MIHGFDNGLATLMDVLDSDLLLSLATAADGWIANSMIESTDIELEHVNTKMP